MKTDNLIDSLGSIDRRVAEVQAFLAVEDNKAYDADAVKTAIEVYLQQRFDETLEDVFEVITHPHLSGSHDFRKILHAASSETTVKVSPAVAVVVEMPVAAPHISNPAKFAAMVEYFAHKASRVYETNLNKLMFYADFGFFDLTGNSISGAVYRHRPYGPVPDGSRQMLGDLMSDGTIIPVKQIENGPTVLKPSETYDGAAGSLTEEEIKMLDWVIYQYGELSAREISDISHRETAYSETKMDEQIDYSYAQKFVLRPPRILFQVDNY